MHNSNTDKSFVMLILKVCWLLVYLNKTFLTMLASSGSKVVEPLPHHLKVGGSSSAPAASSGREQGDNKL